ncbi:MAG: ChbG/HpnK family deacetylase [Gemmatimonadales bacterium]
MKYLIVNADDFGASRGTNRGIQDAHRQGIVTSTSLLVNAPWAGVAAALSGTVPDLSVGLHLDFDGLGEAELEAEPHRQLCRFQDLMGRLPTHIDSHHNAHRDRRVLAHVLHLARQYGLPAREHSPVRFCSKFYGRWGGRTHAEQISVGSLVRLLEAEVRDGVTELSCHPGYADPDLRSEYADERPAEVSTLCDPTLPALLAARNIRLIGFRDLPGVLAGAPA